MHADANFQFKWASSAHDQKGLESWKLSGALFYLTSWIKTFRFDSLACLRYFWLLLHLLFALCFPRCVLLVLAKILIYTTSHARYLLLCPFWAALFQRVPTLCDLRLRILFSFWIFSYLRLSKCYIYDYHLLLHLNTFKWALVSHVLCWNQKMVLDYCQSLLLHLWLSRDSRDQNTYLGKNEKFSIKSYSFQALKLVCIQNKVPSISFINYSKSFSIVRAVFFPS